MNRILKVALQTIGVLIAIPFLIIGFICLFILMGIDFCFKLKIVGEMLFGNNEDDMYASGPNRGKRKI